ncbi:MAG TPA: hypothetical protein VG844_17475 [Terracidiphilus sp.]|nr:hypothetical protein [Terracidiphilus sp.]
MRQTALFSLPGPLHVVRACLSKLASFLILFPLAISVSAQSSVTVRQLEDLLLSKRVRKLSDSALAHEFTQIQLSQQLTDTQLANLAVRIKIGPKSSIGLQLLAANSVFLPPPSQDLPQLPAPDASAQQHMLALARAFVTVNAHQWPDFMAMRTTDSFSDAPLFTRKKQKEPVVEFHLARQTRHEVTVRSGREVPFAPLAAPGSYARPVLGLTTRGEFGPMLSVILNDVQHGSITWSRWQNSADGRPLAVFHYSVPGAASHDVVNLCCYQASQKNPELVPFHAIPAYHGEIIVEPATGAIRAVSLDDEFTNERPIRSAQKFVQFDYVDIGGHSYLCPVRAIAVAVAEDFPTDKMLGFDRIRFINIVSFTGYHKFGSSARVVPAN